jgi:hypothetical protein
MVALFLPVILRLFRWRAGTSVLGCAHVSDAATSSAHVSDAQVGSASVSHAATGFAFASDRSAC